jgi:hypothetical protein
MTIHTLSILISFLALSDYFPSIRELQLSVQAFGSDMNPREFELIVLSPLRVM